VENHRFGVKPKRGKPKPGSDFHFEFALKVVASHPASTGFLVRVSQKWRHHLFEFCMDTPVSELFVVWWFKFNDVFLPPFDGEPPLKRQQPLRKHVRKNLWSPLYHFSQAVSPVLQVVPVQPLSCRLHQLCMYTMGELPSAAHGYMAPTGFAPIQFNSLSFHRCFQPSYPSLSMPFTQPTPVPFFIVFISGNISVCAGCHGRYTKPAKAPYNLCNRHEERWKTVSCPLIRPWLIILKNCLIMLCSNALNCFDYASK